MERNELYKKLESIAYSSYEYSETAREALFALQKDDDDTSSLKQKVETLKASLFIATTPAKPDGHGHWEEVSPRHPSGLRCSECKAKIKYTEAKRFKRCYNCGAIMDEK